MYRKRGLGGKAYRQWQGTNDRQSTSVDQQNSLRQTGDIDANTVVDYGNIEYEMRCVLYNVGAVHSRLAAAQDRSPPLESSSEQITEGTESSSTMALKVACTHLQCAAWAFQVF